MDINSVLSSLQPNDIIITPNRRLAHFLLEQHEAAQIKSGLTCWKTPQIIPVNVWMDLLWRQYAEQTFTVLPHILNPAQEQLVFETILREFDDQKYFLQVVETARLVKSARGLLQQWCVSTKDPLFATAEDYAALAKWITQFETVCEQHNWLDAASLPARITAGIKSGAITTPTRIFHAGFNELSPELNQLLSACPEIHTMTLAQANESIARIAADDADTEIRLMANWARTLHLAAPDQRIGCVLPLLDKKRERVVQIFTEVFGDPAAFNISAGQPLSTYPIINAALTLLTLYKKQLAAETLFYILATPFIGHAESERIPRCQFDSRLRSKNFSTVNLEEQIARDSDQPLSIAKQCPRLAEHIRQFKALLENMPELAPYAYWAQLFNQLLTALGWPGERIINSEEYQVVAEWLKLLQSLTTLDVTASPVPFYEALRVLAQEAATKPFQPQSPAANVQILGILEAGGLLFDYLWISGLDDSNWPAQPKPNPFIPKRLQRELKMPHASAERELEYCEAMTRQFQQSARHVVFSYAKSQDETSMLPSPLIRAITQVTPETLISNFTLPQSELIYQSQALEEIIDVTAPAMQTNESAIGGVEIIKNQALCPFKAFAECRLRARELENPLPGLRSRERGTIVHYILEKCWGVIKTSDALHAMPAAELNQLLDEIIVQALHEHARPQAHQSRYLKLEKMRLKKLALDWLELEKTRPPFSVLTSETSTEIKLNELTLNVRIDRIDQLENGKQLIIDYKTSSTLSVGNWLGERPDEPQLPLYAQRDSSMTAGITFAQIAAGDHCFKGISQMPLEIKGIKPADEVRSTQNKKWDELTDEWRQTLTRLGDDFYQGKAHVDPKEKSTCQYCGLKPLCRVHQEEGEADDA